MAPAIIVAGPTTVMVVTAGTTLETLGFTRDGVIIRQDGYFLDVKTDDTGGEAGPGADTQYLGESALITMELTKWDSTVADKLVQRAVNYVSPGNFALGTGNTVGSLMIAGGFASRLVLSNPTRPRNFPRVIFREPIEVNVGTKYSTLRIEAQAWTNNGVLWNTTIN